MLRAGPAPRIFTVAEAVGLVQRTLEARVGTIWVAGELSNLRPQPSGHVYFTLKDDDSQLAAVMFRSAARRLAFRPADGSEVLALGRVSVYPVRGQLQLYVETLEPRGLGALQLALEELKKRLAAEGLFATERKRPLPAWPRTVGLVTAARGAAVHDMRSVLAARWPTARVVLCPVRVQGEGAGGEIAAGISALNRLGSVDVLIVGRGGGSLEDLWAFNEEVVVRAIATSRAPVVSAVGHEIDFTLSDLAADARAPTPSAAAALVVPDRREVARHVAQTGGALGAALVRRAASVRERLTTSERRLGDPRRRLAEVGGRMDDLANRLARALVRRVRWERRELGLLTDRVVRGAFVERVRSTNARIVAVAGRLRFGLGVRTQAVRGLLATHHSRLEALSPLACLERGYALVRQGGADGPLVRDARGLAVGDRVELVLGHGRAGARVERVDREGSP